MPDQIAMRQVSRHPRFRYRPAAFFTALLRIEVPWPWLGVLGGFPHKE
jgi:hypothetical protein